MQKEKSYAKANTLIKARHEKSGALQWQCKRWWAGSGFWVCVCVFGGCSYLVDTWSLNLGIDLSHWRFPPADLSTWITLKQHLTPCRSDLIIQAAQGRMCVRRRGATHLRRWGSGGGGLPCQGRKTDLVMFESWRLLLLRSDSSCITSPLRPPPSPCHPWSRVLGPQLLPRRCAHQMIAAGRILC